MAFQQLSGTTAQRCAFQTKAVQCRQARRSTVKVNASQGESRRNAIALFGLTLAAPAVADIDIFDDRAGSFGVKALDQARELSLPQDIRDGFQQFRQNIGDTRQRVDESVRRINGLQSNIDKKYWTDLTNELRRQVWYLRLDLNTLTANKPKEAKKQADGLKKDLYAKIDKLDYAAKQKDQKSALSAFKDVQDSLSKAVKFLS